MAEVYKMILSELREIDRNVAELRGRTGSIDSLADSVGGIQQDLASLQTTVASGVSATSDHERRLRDLEAWKARLAGQVVLVAAVVSIVATVAIRQALDRPAAAPPPAAHGAP